MHLHGAAPAGRVPEIPGSSGCVPAAGDTSSECRQQQAAAVLGAAPPPPPPSLMASELRRRRVETRRLCEDRRQLLDLALLQLRDDRRLQPQGTSARRTMLKSALTERSLGLVESDCACVVCCRLRAR